MHQSRNQLDLQTRNLIGTVHTVRGLEIATSLSASHLQGIEIRLDQLGKVPSARKLEAVTLPKILTMRDPQEGGSGNFPSAIRQACLEEAAWSADLIDIELRNAIRYRRLLGRLREQGCRILFSFHDFKKVPSPEILAEKLRQAREEGAHLFKVACYLRNARDIQNLLSLPQAAAGFPVAFMGMGPLGRSSRLLCAALGSVLTYGWLHRSQVSGQWPALELRDRLADALGESEMR